jgi:hypothetical protein
VPGTAYGRCTGHRVHRSCIMSTLIGDLFFGGQSRTDRKQITDLYKTLGPLAKSATETGQSGVGDAMSYFKGLLSGNPTAQAAAAAPATNAVSGQNESERRRLSSEGTSRGGGVNAALQGNSDAATKASVDALTALQPQAASAEGSLGLSETGVGLSSAGTLGGLAESERRTNLQHQGAEGGDIAGIADAALRAFAPAPKPIGFQPTDIAPTGTSGVAGTAPGTADQDWLAALQQQAPELFQ